MERLGSVVVVEMKMRMINDVLEDSGTRGDGVDQILYWAMLQTSVRGAGVGTKRRGQGGCRTSQNPLADAADGTAVEAG